MLPNLRSTNGLPAFYSTHRTLPTMSSFGFSRLIFHWMLDFCLAPRLRVASAQKQSTQTTFPPHFWLVMAGFLTVQLK
jgi:hypothetical protein